MSDLVRMGMPEQLGGEVDFELIAMGILLGSVGAKEREDLRIDACLDSDRQESFLAVVMPGGGIEVEHSCLGGRFCASVFMALRRLAPEKVVAR